MQTTTTKSYQTPSTAFIRIYNTSPITTVAKNSTTIIPSENSDVAREAERLYRLSRHESNTLKNITYLEQAAHFGHVEAMNNLSNHYREKKDFEREVEWCNKATQHGSSHAMYQLACWLLYGPSQKTSSVQMRGHPIVELNINAAIRLFIKIKNMHLKGKNVWDQDYGKNALRQLILLGIPGVMQSILMKPNLTTEDLGQLLVCYNQKFVTEKNADNRIKEIWMEILRPCFSEVIYRNLPEVIQLSNHIPKALNPFFWEAIESQLGRLVDQQIQLKWNQNPENKIYFLLDNRWEEQKKKLIEGICEIERPSDQFARKKKLIEEGLHENEGASDQRARSVTAAKNKNTLTINTLLQQAKESPAGAARALREINALILDCKSKKQLGQYYEYRADIYFQTNRFEESVKDLETALQFGNKEDHIYDNLVNAHIKAAQQPFPINQKQYHFKKILHSCNSLIALLEKERTDLLRAILYKARQYLNRTLGYWDGIEADNEKIKILEEKEKLQKIVVSKNTQEKEKKEEKNPAKKRKGKKEESKSKTKEPTEKEKTENKKKEGKKKQSFTTPSVTSKEKSTQSIITIAARKTFWEKKYSEIKKTSTTPSLPPIIEKTNKEEEEETDLEQPEIQDNQYEAEERWSLDQEILQKQLRIFNINDEKQFPTFLENLKKAQQNKTLLLRHVELLFAQLDKKNATFDQIKACSSGMFDWLQDWMCHSPFTKKQDCYNIGWLFFFIRQVHKKHPGSVSSLGSLSAETWQCFLTNLLKQEKNPDITYCIRETLNIGDLFKSFHPLKTIMLPVLIRNIPHLLDCFDRHFPSASKKDSVIQSLPSLLYSLSTLAQERHDQHSIPSFHQTKLTSLLSLFCEECTEIKNSAQKKLGAISRLFYALGSLAKNSYHWNKSSLTTDQVILLLHIFVEETRQSSSNDPQKLFANLSYGLGHLIEYTGLQINFHTSTDLQFILTCFSNAPGKKSIDYLHVIYGLIMLEWDDTPYIKTLFANYQTRLKYEKKPSYKIDRQLHKCISYYRWIKNWNLSELGISEKFFLQIEKSGGRNKPDNSSEFHKKFSPNLENALRRYRENINSIVNEYYDCGYFIDIALFCSDGRRIALELEGEHHFDEKGNHRAHDQWRQRLLEKAGWKIIFIKNSNNMKTAVYNVIQAVTYPDQVQEKKKQEEKEGPPVTLLKRENKEKEQEENNNSEIVIQVKLPPPSPVSSPKPSPSSTPIPIVPIVELKQQKTENKILSITTVTPPSPLTTPTVLTTPSSPSIVIPSVKSTSPEEKKSATVFDRARHGEWISLPKILHPAAKLIVILMEMKCQAYFVGNVPCDILLKKEILDQDIVHNASEEKMQGALKKLNIVVKYHHTPLNNVDKLYFYDSQHGSISIDLFRNPNLDFDHLSEDSYKRDLTRSALYICVRDQGGMYQGQYKDPLNLALKHVEEKQIVLIGEPRAKLTEDLFRIFRLIKKSVTEKIPLSDAYKKLIQELYPILQQYVLQNKTRVNSCFDHFFVSKYKISYWDTASELKLFEVLFPTFTIFEDDASKNSVRQHLTRLINSSNEHRIGIQIVYALFIFLEAGKRDGQITLTRLISLWKENALIENHFQHQFNIIGFFSTKIMWWNFFITYAVPLSLITQLPIVDVNHWIRHFLFFNEGKRKLSIEKWKILKKYSIWDYLFPIFYKNNPQYDAYCQELLKKLIIKLQEIDGFDYTITKFHAILVLGEILFQKPEFDNNQVIESAKNIILQNPYMAQEFDYHNYLPEDIAGYLALHIQNLRYAQLSVREEEMKIIEQQPTVAMAITTNTTSALSSSSTSLNSFFAPPSLPAPITTPTAATTSAVSVCSTSASSSCPTPSSSSSSGGRS